MNTFLPMDLSEFLDQDIDMNLKIEGKKCLNEILSSAASNAKPEKCYYCGNVCKSFCNSHSLPEFFMRNIAENGKIFYSNSVLGIPIKKEVLGVKEAGTFHILCRECDSKIFQEYENKENYQEVPTQKMLAQIDMKNSLKNIGKRRLELEIYKGMAIKFPELQCICEGRTSVAKMDLPEYENSFKRAKKQDLKSNFENYYVGFYTKLPYVAPMAFQGTVALIADFESNTINNIYNYKTSYVIQHLNIVVFPHEAETTVMLFIDHKNQRYKRFFKQLRKLPLDKQLSTINYIIFAYSEDYFLSPLLPKNVRNELSSVAGKTSEGLSVLPSSEELIDCAKDIYNYDEAENIPNLLSVEYSLGQLRKSNTPAQES